MTEEFKKGEEYHSASLFKYLMFRIASEIVDKVIINKASWSDVFAKHDFFHKYRYYLQVIASTGNQDLQIKW